MILLDRSGPAPKVLLGKRHHGLTFMPGIYVFPGGGVEVADARAPSSGTLTPHVERALHTLVRSPRPPHAYALAAIRELAEETGMMLGCKGVPAPQRHPPQWTSFAEHGVTPVLDGIRLIARTITPPGLIRRYDTRFFAADADAVCHTVPGAVHEDAELVDLRWVSVDATDDLDMHTVSRLVLAELVRRLEVGLDRDLPVPFLRARGGTLRRYEL